MPFSGKLFGYIKKNTLIFRTLLLFFIAGSLMMFLVSGLIMGVIKGRFIRDTEENSRYFVEQSYNIAEILLEPLYDRLYRLYSSDDVIIKAMYGSNLKITDYGIFFKRLREEQKNNNLISSMYIYNAEEDLIFYYFDGASGITERELMFDRSAVLMIGDDGVKPVFIPRKAVFTDTYGTLTVDENWISIFFGPNRGVSTPAFIVNINQDRLQQLIESPVLGEGRKSLIIDRDGVIISSSDHATINQNVGKDRMYRLILDSASASGSFSYRDGKNNFPVSYKKSPSLGWVFVGLSNEQELLAGFNKTQTVMTIISALFMLASLVVSFFVSKNMYTPLYNLMQTVHEADNRKDIDLSMKVYDELQDDYLELVNSVKKLESDIERFTETKAKAAAASETKKTEWVRIAADYIDKNFSNGNLSVDIIADYIGLSPNYLRAIFKAARGISLSKYLIDVRMTHVKKMLLTTNIHVHEIAEQSGFVNTKHFYVIFKQYTGLTTEMFRKSNGVFNEK